MTTAQESLTGPTPSSPLRSGEEQTTNTNESRCTYTSSDGRQCRNPAKVYPHDEFSPVRDKKVGNLRASLCVHHASSQLSSADEVAPDAALEGLQALCSDLSTATNINRALAHTYLLMAQGRISRKDAIAFGYLTQLLLQTVPGVRAEYVSLHGYLAWEEKLKASMPQAQDHTDLASERGGADSDRSEENPEHSSNVVGPQGGVPGAPPLSHIEDIYERSLDLFAGKYDLTPEGRAEARKLALEIELMKSPDSKPPRGRLGEVVSLVRRAQAHQQPKAVANAAAKAAPPTATAVSAPQLPNPEAVSPNPSVANAAPPKLDTGSSVPTPAFAVPPDPTRVSPSPYRFAAADSALAVFPAAPLLPTRRKKFARLAPPPFEDCPFAPVDYFDAPPEEENPPKREGHTTDWYVPPSWSNNQPPDPFPSRREKLARKFRAMGNVAFRRRQHRMQSQTFWEQPR